MFDLLFFFIIILQISSLVLHQLHHGHNILSQYHNIFFPLPVMCGAPYKSEFWWNKTFYATYEFYDIKIDGICFTTDKKKRAWNRDELLIFESKLLQNWKETSDFIIYFA